MLLATDVTLYNSRMPALVSNATGIKFAPDGNSVGKQFIYEARIHTMNRAGDMHTVFCVQKNAKAVGTRIVDVGFPLFNVEKKHYWCSL